MRCLKFILKSKQSNLKWRIYVVVSCATTFYYGVQTANYFELTQHCLWKRTWCKRKSHTSPTGGKTGKRTFTNVAMKWCTRSSWHHACMLRKILMTMPFALSNYSKIDGVPMRRVLLTTFMYVTLLAGRANEGGTTDLPGYSQTVLRDRTLFENQTITLH